MLFQIPRRETIVVSVEGKERTRWAWEKSRSTAMGFADVRVNGKVFKILHCTGVCNCCEKMGMRKKNSHGWLPVL